MVRKKLRAIIIGFIKKDKLNDSPSVRTICPRGEELLVNITTKRRCGKSSVAASVFDIQVKNVLK